VVTPGDHEALARALVSAARSSFDVAAGWARIRRDHSPDKLAAIYLRAYRQATGASAERASGW